MGMNWKNLFSNHISVRQKTTEKILAANGYNGLVVDGGKADYYYEDDQSWTYRPNHHFSHWCPISAPLSLLLVVPGKKPILYFVSPRDYWHDSPELGAEFWQSEFDIKIVDTEKEAWDFVRYQSKLVYHGPRAAQAKECGLITEPEQTFWAQLNWERSFKTPYEISCLDTATKKSAQGHIAAKNAFDSGGSEREIYLAYLQATGDLEREMPYNSIVCLDEKAAILHYTQQRKEPRNGKVLLIDAGAQINRYGCDITRTHYRKDTLKEFREIVDGVNRLQQDICAVAAPGKSMVDLHGMAHEKIAELLLKVGVFEGISKEDILSKGLTNTFFPHGIGHMLGIFVHDVAGKQRNGAGDPVPTKHLEQDPRYKFLRSHRELESGNVITVEPGVYFIPMLLDAHRTGATSRFFNWSLIDQLTDLGGVRVEDDIYITANGHQNLTRPYLP
jgi:Xaa-Pro dipeptidase